MGQRFRLIDDRARIMADADIPLLRPATRVRRQEGLLATDLAGQVIMMDAEKGLYFELDPIGTDVWRRLESPILVADLVADLTRDYDATPAEVERDVLALLNDMAAHGLVTTC